MLRRKLKQGQEWLGGTILDRLVREGLSQNDAFEQRPDGFSNDGASHVGIWRKNIPT